MDSNETQIRVEEDGPRRTIHVNGPLDLPNTETVRQALLESVVRSGDASLDTLVGLAGLTRIDLSGLQLLCSSHRTAISRGNSLRLADPPAWFQEFCSAAGFARSRSTCPHRRGDECIWSA